MALYLDCASLDEVRSICEVYPVEGVTTNPSILLAAAREGQRLNDIAILRELLAICSGPVFMQPTAETADDLYTAAMRYVELDPARVVLKLPMAANGVAAGRHLRADGARLAYTATYCVSQAYTAALAGAEWVIPYFGRLRRAGLDAADRIGAMAEMLANQAAGTRILAASLKSSADVVEAVLAGAHDVTVPPDVIRALAEDPLSQDAISRFADDWREFQREIGGEG